ncbi:MAG: beta-lactamase family protein, partial [Tannerella sp.]|nr:beta-lactamase family protein [Tannerella sp.]
MNKIRIISFAVCCIAIVSCSKSGRFEMADKALDAVLDNYRYVGLAVVVVKDNEVIYSSERGLKNIRTGQKIGKDDLFRIASISKTFTSTAIMQLYEQGCFDLDDDVSEALGYRVRNPAFPDAKIT